MPEPNQASEKHIAGLKEKGQWALMKAGALEQSKIMLAGQEKVTWEGNEQSKKKNGLNCSLHHSAP